MDYKIRYAEPHDIDEIINLCEEHAEFEKAEYSPVRKAERLAKYLFIDQPPLFCLIAENSAGELLGYTTFMQEFSTWDAAFYMHMDCLFLRPHARNFGIGEQLIRKIAKRAEALNCKQIQWHTPAFNEKAVKFYHRIGATSRQKSRLYLDEKAIEELAK